MKWDYHVHLERGPYNRDWMYRFLEAAQLAGIDEIGFSEHAYRFRQTEDIWPCNWNLKAEVDADKYVMLVQEAKGNGSPIKLGVEVDFVPGKEEQLDRFISQYPWDYVIGSVHFIDEWGFDRPDQAYLWDQRDIGEAYRHYFALFTDAAKTKLFDIMAHPDVIKVYGYRPKDSLIDEYIRCADILRQTDTCFEISTAGLRKPVGELYPAPCFTQMLVEADVTAIINSDAHRPEDVGHGFDAAYAYAQKYGITKLARFSNRQRLLVDLDCSCQ
ncbi:MAG: histidinol-phosphatase HisJ family protein [Firmicutes bacterium]|nr:histidinol-phosphatase HisJ family protein [Bacillota bacterium]